MMSERIRRQIERFLDAAEEAASRFDWDSVRENAHAVLRLDPENADALTYLAAADRDIAAASPASGAPQPTLVSQPSSAHPTSFVNGRYVVIRFLGEGSKKKVYHAHDILLDRDVAFALIKLEGLDDISRARIIREAQAMAKLGDHLHIVTLYDIGTEGDQPYIVTQLMAGGDVEGLIEKAQDHKLPLEQAIRLAQQVCRRWSTPTSMRLFIGDIKPGNVWLTLDGTAKLGDFGLAVALDRSRLTQVGMMVGTVSYMPPEQAMGGEPDKRSDLYSLGAMLYEMVAGRPPYLGGEPLQHIVEQLQSPLS